MKKIQVEICLGTTCFIMGGSQLQEVENLVFTKYRGAVEVSAKACLGLCHSNGEYSKAPYAKVNEKVISEATAEKILDAIESSIL